MNRPEFREEIRALLGVESPDRDVDGNVSRAQLNIYINLAQKELVNDFMVYAPNLLRDVKTFATVAGTYLYDLPEGLINDQIGLTIRDDSDRDLVPLLNGLPDITASSEYSTAYTFYGRQIWLYPKPTAIKTYKVYGRYYPAALTDAIDENTGTYIESELPEDLQHLVCLKAALYGTASSGDSFDQGGPLRRMYNDALGAYRATVMQSFWPDKNVDNIDNRYMITRSGYVMR